MAITGQGTTLNHGGLIADVVSISTPSVSVATLDTTNITSIHRTFIAGTIDSGEMSVEIMYDPNSDADIETSWDSNAVAAPTAATTTITFADSGNSTFIFQAILTGFEANVAIDEKVTATLTFKVTGSIALAT